MNISYNWLKEYIDFDLSPEDTAAALTSIGLETEGLNEIQTIKGGLEGLVIGEVLTCIPHPNSDHLHLTTVNIGEEEPLKIVCGAPNVATNQKVVVATIGTTLYNEDKEFKIKRSKIRGEESHGMICSEVEIGVGASDSGIIVLPENATVGMPAKDYYNIKSDYLLEVDITPNRVDATSHFGVARDLAAYLKQANKPYKLTKPSVENLKVDKNIEGGIDIEVRNSIACPRYAGLTIRNLKVDESPAWLKDRLQTIGVRPINNIVDITNFVLHETGQPLHAFDAKYIKDNKVIVDTLEKGTKFITLDEQERILHEDDLMICNTESGMCLAGVFGGIESGVTQDTQDVFLESAYFNPTWVRKSSRRHGLHTDSSFRFERGVDPNNIIYALKRAATLILEIAGGKIEGVIRDIYPQKISEPQVELRYEKVTSLIGKEIANETIKSILQSLDITVTNETNEALYLSIPTYRVDVLRDVDVIEEILRIYGYNNIEITDSLKSNLSYESITDKKHNLQTLISEQLTAQGFYEIMNNSLTEKSYYQDSKVFPVKNNVALLNPLSNDLNVMRQTLLYGGLENIIHNINRKHPDLNLYEFGNCYFYNKENLGEGNLDQFKESTLLGIWICGKRRSKNWSVVETESTVFELKANIENILSRMGLSQRKITHEQYSDEIFASGMRLTIKNAEIGKWGIIQKDILKHFDIETNVYFAELNWDNIIAEAMKNEVQYTEVSKFPSVKRDLALLIDKNVTFAEIEEIAYQVERKILKEITLFDVYEGRHLPEGKKSYAVNFILQDNDKTLEDKRIDSTMRKIQTSLEKQLGAQLR